jgi:hypothetical protein
LERWRSRADNILMERQSRIFDWCAHNAKRSSGLAWTAGIDRTGNFDPRDPGSKPAIAAEQSRRALESDKVLGGQCSDSQAVQITERTRDFVGRIESSHTRVGRPLIGWQVFLGIFLLGKKTALASARGYGLQGDFGVARQRGPRISVNRLNESERVRVPAPPIVHGKWS